MESDGSFSESSSSESSSDEIEIPEEWKIKF